MQGFRELSQLEGCDITWGDIAKELYSQGLLN